MGQEELLVLLVEYCETKKLTVPDDWFELWIDATNKVPHDRTLHDIFDFMFKQYELPIV
jgi:hypothetical protein